MSSPAPPPWTDAQRDRLRQGFVLGLRRHPIELDPATLDRPSAKDAGVEIGEDAGSEPELLAALALLAQQQRFADPPPVPADLVLLGRGDGDHDPRPLPPEQARPALLWLLTDKALRGDVGLAAGLLRRIAAFGWRLHPFDLPAMKPLLQAHAGLLGPSERRFLAADGALQVSDPGDDHITADNWTEFGKKARADFLTVLRSSDPDAARELLHLGFAAEPAATRAELIPAMAVGLGAADREFLEGLRKDRSSRVKQTVTELLGRLPETDEYRDRIELLGPLFEFQPARPLGSARLALKGPVEQLQGLRLDDLPIEPTIEALFDPAAKRPPTVKRELAAGLFRAAVGEQRWPLAGRIAAAIDAFDWVEAAAVLAGQPAPPRPDPGLIALLVALPPIGRVAARDLVALAGTLAGWFGGPLPVALAEQLLQPKLHGGLRDALQGVPGLPVALLFPPELAGPAGGLLTSCNTSDAPAVAGWLRLLRLKGQ